MAQFRLKTAHQLRHRELGVDAVLPGDKENERLPGDIRGTLVGTGTPWLVKSATLEMEPLDDEAREMIAAEEDRLTLSSGSMNPMEQIPLTMVGAARDDYEDRFLPGFPGTLRPTKGQ